MLPHLSATGGIVELPFGRGGTGTPPDDGDYQVPFAFTGKLEKLTIDLGDTTATPGALAEMSKLLAARNLPVFGDLVGDFEDFVQRMQQGGGP